MEAQQNYFSHFYLPSKNSQNTENIADFIPHPSENKHDDDILTRHIFVIDSRQRDYSKYPDPNNYTINVPNFYKNVKSLELKGATLPKTEYNIHSCNNNLPFIIGDFIYSIAPKSNFFSNSSSLSIIPDGQTVTFTITGGTVNAILSATTLNGGIGPITITYGGTGYSPDNMPTVVASVSAYPNYTPIRDFVIKIGIFYEAILREGQYSNAGNPKFLHMGIPVSGVTSRTPLYSNTPVSGFTRELECAMADAIYSRNTLNYAISNQRIGWYELNYDNTAANYTVGGTNESIMDYPLPISARYVNQYPVLGRYSAVNITSTSDRSYYDTNSCNFNRIQFSNNLVIKLSTTSANPTNVGGIFQYNKFQYTVVDYYKIGTPDAVNYQYLLVLQPTGTCASNGSAYSAGWEIYDITNRWVGISAGGTLGTAGATQFINPATINVASITPCPWHFPFNQNYTDLTTMLGFSKLNHCNGTLTTPIYIENDAGSSQAVLQASGYTHRTDYDWTLDGSPEYVILSFRSPLNRSTGSSDSEFNNRIDSDNESNIGRSFACLLFDHGVSAVLKGLTFSNGPNFDLSGTYQANQTEFSGILKTQNLTINTTNTQYVRLLDGYIGNTNSAFNVMTYMPATKTWTGSDYDIKKICFKQAVSRLDTISIQFNKFNKINSNSSKELYDFKGKEHFLMFEIVTADNYNVF